VHCTISYPEILILDEGTSALDTETENYIMESVAHLKGKLNDHTCGTQLFNTSFLQMSFTKCRTAVIISKGKLEELV
jgi:ABC-type methionine transport system ATPase subunit